MFSELCRQLQKKSGRRTSFQVVLVCWKVQPMTAPRCAHTLLCQILCIVASPNHTPKHQTTFADLDRRSQNAQLTRIKHDGPSSGFPHIIQDVLIESSHTFPAPLATCGLGLAAV